NVFQIEAVNQQFGQGGLGGALCGHRTSSIGEDRATIRHAARPRNHAGVPEAAVIMPGMTVSASRITLDASTSPRLDVRYSDDNLASLLTADDTLAVFGFGSDAPASADPRYLRIGLQQHGPGSLEVW